MEQFEKIIEARKIPLTPFNVSQIAASIFFTGASLYALWTINFVSKLDPFKEPVDFYNVIFIIGTLLCFYIVFLSFHKLRIRFFENGKPTTKKSLAIEKIAEINKWKLKKHEPNYYVFWENNWIFQSYDITIVFDNKGFYINSYPSLGKVFDFGASTRKTNDIYEELRNHL